MRMEKWPAGTDAARLFLCRRENLSRSVADELGEAQVAKRLGDRLPAHGFGKDERKIALDRLKARELPRDRLAQRQTVETVEINFADINGSAGFCAAAPAGWSWPNQATVAVGHGACGTPGMQPRGSDARIGGNVSKYKERTANFASISSTVPLRS